MSEMTDFRIGDRVFHASMGKGTVTVVGDRIHVEFDAISRRDGRPTVGIYDAAWFRQNGELLYSCPNPPKAQP